MAFARHWDLVSRMLLRWTIGTHHGSAELTALSPLSLTFDKPGQINLRRSKWSIRLSIWFWMKGV